MAATTPEERLCSRSWRLLHSWWLIVPIISLGILNFLPFLVNGLRARRVSWLILAGAFLIALTFYSVVLANIDTGTKTAPKNAYVGGFLIINWIAGIGASVVTNRSRLRWRAAKDDRAWYRAGVSAPSRVTAPATEAHVLIDAALGGVFSPDAHSPATSATVSAGDRVDINTASREQLAATLHLDPEAVTRIEAARDRLGGFRDADQLMTEAGLPPHVFLALRERVSVSPTRSGLNEGRRAGGRRLDF